VHPFLSVPLFVKNALKQGVFACYCSDRCGAKLDLVTKRILCISCISYRGWWFRVSSQPRLVFHTCLPARLLIKSDTRAIVNSAKAKLPPAAGLDSSDNFSGSFTWSEAPRSSIDSPVRAALSPFAGPWIGKGHSPLSKSSVTHSGIDARVLNAIATRWKQNRGQENNTILNRWAASHGLQWSFRPWL